MHATVTKVEKGHILNACETKEILLVNFYLFLFVIIF